MLVFAWIGVARAEDGVVDADPPEVIVVSAPQSPDLQQGSASVTRLDAVTGASAGESLGDLLDRAPGTDVSRLGGLGDWSAVSIRGASSRSVAVTLDGVPLNPDGIAAVNLAELPLAGLSHVDVWRGGAPFAGASAPMGGAVNLVTGEASARQVTAMVGSHGTARVSAVGGGGGAFVATEAFGTQGGYRWYDDAGTRWNADDDAFRRRVNNDKAQLTGLARWSAPSGVTLLASGLARDEGLPGHSGAPVLSARLGTTRGLASAAWRGGGDDLGGGGSVWGAVRDERLSDPNGEIGLSSKVIRSRTSNGGVTAQVTGVLAEGLVARAAIDARLDFGGAPGGGADRRVSGATLLGADVEHLGWVWSPVVRVAGWDARGEASGVGATDGSVDPRLGAWRDVGSCAVRGNVGRYLRAPDPLELFGDRGDMVGNPALRPERGWSADLGASCRASGVRVEAAAFGSRSTDLIVWAQNGQRVWRAENVGEAAIVGVEAGLGGAVGAWRWDVGGGGTLGRNLSDDPAYRGNALPRVPAWDLDGRIAWDGATLSVGYALSASGGDFADATNWWWTPPRWVHSASIGAHPAGSSVTVGVEVLDLLDRVVARGPANPLDPSSEVVPMAVTDFGGYPLAGRTLLVSVRAGGPR